MNITIPYSPRPLQENLHKSLKRFNVIVCHRRFGKTVFCINEIIKRAMTNTKRRPQYAYIAPTMKQAKVIAWDYLKHYTGNIPHMKYNESELKCEFPNGAKVYILGAENPDSLRGLYLDGAVLDEVAQMPQSIWGQVLRPALADREGWAIFIGTPKGQNYFYELYNRAKVTEGWFNKVYKASQTNILPDSELRALRAETSEEEYDQELECSFTAAVQGTYYGKAMLKADEEGRIKTVAHDASSPVITAWDLGYNDLTAIWFIQNITGEIRVVDYYENSNESIPFYVNVLKNKPYVYDYHILPHDSKQTSVATGKSSLEMMQKLGMKTLVAPKMGILEGINAVKMLLPSCYFDEAKCAKGIVALRNYRSDYNEKLGTFAETPRHDEHSHASDAFRYLAITLKPPRSPVQILEMNRLRNKHHTTESYDPFE